MTQPQTPAASLTVVENVLLEEFEHAVYARDHELAVTLLLRNLRRFKAGGLFVGYARDEELQRLLYTRFCAAVIALLADPQFSMNQHGLDSIGSEHAVMDLLFRASSFGTSDHLLPLISANPMADATKLRMDDGGAVLKFLLTYSLVSGFSLNFEATFRRDPQVVLGLYAGMLSPLLTVDSQAHAQRETLLGLHEMFADCTLTNPVIPTLSDAYMYCSYAVRRDKHEVKATIHKLFADMLKANRVPLPVFGEPERKERPTILVAVEWFGANHAMYRCYARAIRELRTRFRLVAMSTAIVIDEQGKAEFDEWIEINPERLILSELVDKITEITPDIIYYPSLGMAPWWVALASVRLAPIQVLSVGHPASSRSPAMDYVLCDAGAIGDPTLFTEEIVEYPDGSTPYLMRPDAELPAPHVEGHPEIVHVAVPAMLCKLNAEFMATLREIADQVKARSDRPVKFHFFINMLGVNLAQAATEIRRWLPDSRIYERRHYNQYMQELRQCHLHLSTFPFGGTNSNIDSMLLGIPIVTLWGDEPHERFDGMLLRRAGMPESLIAKSRDEYVTAAVELITSDEARNALRDSLLQCDLQAAFFGEPPVPDAFVGAMESIYERQFDQSGSPRPSAGRQGADGGGRRGARTGDTVVPFPGKADRAGRDAQGLGRDRGLPGGERA
jgi:hypothetical protein